MKKVQHYINGQFMDSQCGEFFDNFNPATAELISKVALGREAEVNAAVAAAKAALTGAWGQMKLNDRVALMYEVADEINRRFDDFLEAECLDTGKPYSIARHIDIPRGGANFKVFADTMKSYADEAYRADTPDGKKMLNYSMRKPKGVIAVISPWNLPLLLMTWKVGPAMACGNSVVVKPSQVTPTTTSLLGEVMSKVGVPAGAYNVVQGKGSITGNLLTAHKDIDAITFTGETVTGEMIMKACSVGVRDVSLELGGKNPAIIFADCDMEKAVHETTRSCFANSGQVCLGTERVYVQRPIFDEFVSKLKESASKLKLGVQHDESVDMGPLVSAAHRDKVLEFYEIAKKEGANIVLGGGAPKMEGPLSNGFWVEPTIWTGLPESATVIQQEVFGPCCHVTPFDTEEDAIRMANDTKYGLASTIFTENLDKAHRVASQIDAGIVWINSWFLRDLRTPFGGMKASGIGREGGHHSLEFYTELKNICIKM